MARVMTGGLRSDIDLPPPVMAGDNLGDRTPLGNAGLVPGNGQNAGPLCQRLDDSFITHLGVFVKR